MLWRCDDSGRAYHNKKKFQRKKSQNKAKQSVVSEKREQCAKKIAPQQQRASSELFTIYARI